MPLINHVAYQTEALFGNVGTKGNLDSSNPGKTKRTDRFSHPQT
jgi:hypothetical protein